jgi:hypothetical protein
MRILPRSVAPSGAAALAVAATLLAACAAVTPVATPTMSAPTASVAVNDPAARAAYQAAICPVLTTVAEMDDPLAALRAAGEAGGDMTAHAEAMNGVADDLRVVLTDLDAVPVWDPGQRLRFELLSSIHAIRARIVATADHLDTTAAAREMAAIPYVASIAMDRAMARAIENGFDCASAS